MSQRHLIFSLLFRDCGPSTSFFHLLSFSFLSDYQLLHGELPHHAVAKDNTHLIIVYDCVGHDFRLVVLCFPWCRWGWLSGVPLGAGLVRTIPDGFTHILGALAGWAAGLDSTRPPPGLASRVVQPRYRAAQANKGPRQKLPVLSKSSLKICAGLPDLAKKMIGRPVQFEFHLNNNNY